MVGISATVSGASARASTPRPRSRRFGMVAEATVTSGGDLEERAMSSRTVTHPLDFARRALRRTLVPLALLLLAPPFVMLLSYGILELDGSLSALLTAIYERGPVEVLRRAWVPYLLGSPTAWAILAVFAASQLALTRLLPGRLVAGPVTPGGWIPRYRANGMLAFVVTVVAFLGASYGLGLFEASILYDRFPELIGALNIASLGLCAALYVKGRVAPSGPDRVVTGNPVFDLFAGVELHPRVLGWDLKQLINGRLGMMAWPLLILSYAAAQSERHGLSDSMLVAVGLQLVYIAKFFYWEPGYWRSLDVMHDRAGFYICWGCLVWLPVVYTSHTLYLVDHPHQLGAPIALGIGLAGVASIAVNYLADRQRQRVRATRGHTRVWGREPELIHARYTTEDGKERESLLLTSGFWGLSRHFHYLPEWTAAVFWTLPVLFDAALPWTYVIFLGVLLTDRAFRDDRRCAEKYGADWDEYRRRVPYRIVPGVF